MIDVHLTDIFAKDVQRPIEGVIKADDAAHLGSEVDEYVLTNEAAKGLEHLLEVYTDSTNANGVWISGFFGSGKSHLLKMLAHLLGDVAEQAFPRAQVSASFRAKAEGAFLPALLAKADAIPARSLLFNIDQKATLISKEQTDALLRVFVKVFDEARGYYGNQGHVARFERDLDDEGQYEAFKEAFEQLSGTRWVDRRVSSALPTVRRQVNEAYARATGSEVHDGYDILASYQSSYSVSIEDFADEVKAWLDRQEPGFRLNFFVDEVGQFIGSNTQLMLNLQTIAESLGTKCRGRAWIFVTSQEDMERIVGDRTKQQGNDFSKIQARFKTRVKLTSADVEEVIRKRLLEKKERGRIALEALYTKEAPHFKTLFGFADGAKTYRNYPTQAHFVGVYPFVSYQFPLFQEAIQGISDHNAFEGRNSSVGERSMLAVVQEVVKSLGDAQVGDLAPFDAMFAGIRSSLKSAALRSVEVAERHLDDELAVRLLKALFLVKYVDGFKATPRNLTVLVHDRFGLDLDELSERVKSALRLLEAQTYVQRNGNVYSYLTNEEQEMEREIKNVEIDSSEVARRLHAFLSGDVIKTSKIRYAKNKQDFAFSYKLDDQSFGQTRELSVHFITPEYAYGPDTVRAHSVGKSELRVILEPDERLLPDLRLLLKTEKYAKLKHSSSLSAVQQRILQAKVAQNAEREKDVVTRLRRAVGEAALVIDAVDVNSTSADAITRVTDGFQILVARTYANLGMLGDRTYSEQQIAAFADPDDPNRLFDESGGAALAEPAAEMLAYIRRRIRLGEQVKVKTIVDAFQTKPYGWDVESIECVIAWLFGDAKIALTLDGNALKRTEVPAALRNAQKHAYLVVGLQKTFDERGVERFRQFLIDFFDAPGAPKDPIELAREGARRLAEQLDQLRMQATGSTYPFVTALREPIALLEQVTGKPDEWYLTEFAGADDLLDAKQDVIQPIQEFLNGGQRKIYDDAAELLRSAAANLGYLEPGSDRPVAELLDDPDVYRGMGVVKLKNAAAALAAELQGALRVNREQAKERLAARHDELRGIAEKAEAPAAALRDVERRIDSLRGRIEHEQSIAAVRELANTFSEQTYPSLIEALYAAAAAAKQPSTTDPVPSAGDAEPAAPKPVVVSITSIHVNGGTGVLETAEDVDQYLQALRASLVDALDAGKRIAL